jgi:ABC-type thiamin/hydroxymethylpyrimidine transport system permease subunit
LLGRRRTESAESSEGEAGAGRAGWADRGRGAGASLLRLLARLVWLVASILAAVIGVGIVFVVFDANERNIIVSQVTDWARALVGPFHGIFRFRPPEVAIAVNWGLALVVYLIVGAIIAGLLRAAALRSEPSS